ncbi:MAG: L-glutamate gamma-semialdehyde dehydrogenase, partial [Sphingorhabdus sp.]
TTKAATDVCYLACARRLIAASPHLYAQFATHNAHSLAAVRAMAIEANTIIEHQRLHGMGEALYDAATASYGPLRIRAYAPVGGYEELLPYLVRRLLENGANTSFVNQLLDERVPPDEVAPDPLIKLEARPTRHPNISVPAALYGPMRANPLGRDFTIKSQRDAQEARHLPPLVPVGDATEAEICNAAARGRSAYPAWNAAGGVARGSILRAMADGLDANMDRLVTLLSAEAGKTLNDGVSEVREAIDFCRYYASLAETQFERPTVLNGPTGETNQLMLAGRGVFACISPWNFPLAIFTGQIAAALAAGNAVLAKPAEQTPRIALEAAQIFYLAGLNPDLLTVLPGDGTSVGAALVTHGEIDGVAFTGGTQTAWTINRSIANRDGPIIPFIAETGGLNAMFLDTSALKEQVVDDVVLSAFGSAGQRCSALRILFVPHECADAIIETIKGAMDVLVIGDPHRAQTDIGPVIDAEAQAMLEDHVNKLEREAVILHRCTLPPLNGNFFAPTLAQIDSVGFLKHEIFGPILHVIRYDQRELARVAQSLADTRYGLTLGIHSRLDSFASEVCRRVPAGNVYVNRSMIGAVVGVQPFGGNGLSGTGPKAGGPHALLRYATEYAVSNNITAKGGDPLLMAQAS